MSNHEFSPHSLEEVAYRDVYCEHYHKGDRYSRVGDNANYQANLPLRTDECVDVRAVNPLVGDKKKMNQAKLLLEAKRAQREKNNEKNRIESQALSAAVRPAKSNKVIIQGLGKLSTEKFNVKSPENLGNVAAPKTFTSENQSDRCDIAWAVSEALRTDLFNEDALEAVQTYLYLFMSGENAYLDENTPSAMHRPNNHDFSKQIADPKRVSTCLLYDEETENSKDTEVPQSGLRLYQYSAWHLLRAMATAQRSDFQEIFDKWKNKHEPFESDEEYLKRPKAYDGFQLNRSVTHNGLNTPRGVLINHSTGSGKTSVSVASIQAFWFQSDRPLLYVSTEKAVASVIGKRSDDKSCGGSNRSEYARLASLFFPSTLGSDEAAYDPALNSGHEFGSPKPGTSAANGQCVQTYLGDPGQVSSRLKALTFTQLSEFIKLSGNGREVDEMCQTRTRILKEDGSKYSSIPTFGAKKMSVANAVIIVDEAHNLLSQAPDENMIKALKHELSSAKKSNHADKLQQELSKLLEKKACNEIFDYLKSGESKGITLVFLTATPGNTLEEINSLCNLLQRVSKVNQEQVLVSYYNAENNLLDFPKLITEKPTDVIMTPAQSKEVAEQDSEYSKLLASTIPEYARAMLPSKFMKVLFGGAKEDDDEIPRQKNEEYVEKQEQMINNDLEKKEEEDNEIDGRAEYLIPEPKDERESENESFKESIELDKKLKEWQKSIDDAVHLYKSDAKIEHAEESTEYKPKEFPTKFVKEWFQSTDSDSFVKQAPKLGAVSDKMNSGSEKTFAYTSFSDATEGLCMLMEHRHQWRMISKNVLAELYKLFFKNLDVTESSEDLGILEDRMVRGGTYEEILHSVRAVIQDTKKLLENITKGKQDSSGGFPDTQHIAHLNRDIPKSISDLVTEANICEQQLNVLPSRAEEENKEALHNELERLAARITGTWGSAQNMNSLIESVGDGDISASITRILEENEVNSYQADVSSSNPKGGKPKKRFVVVNDHNAKLVMKVFNHFINRDGDILMAVLGNGNSLEGLDFKTTRRVFAVEPMTTPIKLQQLLGRARRYCSHADLPRDQRNVTFSVFRSVLNPRLEEEIVSKLREFREAQENYVALKKEAYADSDAEIRTKEAELKNRDDMATLHYEKAVRDVINVRQTLANTRSRLQEVRSTGGAINFTAVKFAGDLKALKSVVFPRALREVENAVRGVIDSRNAYSKFQREEGSSILFAKIVKIEPARLLVSKLRTEYEHEYGHSIEETIISAESVEQDIMDAVAYDKLLLDNRLKALKDSATDKDILTETMNLFDKPY